jgi:hypothetical protein
VSSDINGIAYVSGITIMLALPQILCYPAVGIIVCQAFVTAGRGCFFDPSSLCPIVRLVFDGWLTSSVTHRWFSYSNLNYSLNPLLGQSFQWRVLKIQALN